MANVWFEESLNFYDAAIWYGQRKYLQDIGITPDYECSDRNYCTSCLRDSVRDGSAILLRGGGNSGDLYCNHMLRLDILKAFKRVLVIQLPLRLFSHLFLMMWSAMCNE